MVTSRGDFVPYPGRPSPVDADGMELPGTNSGFGPVAPVVVFAPAPLLTITIEQRGRQSEAHLHAGAEGSGWPG